VLGEPQVLGQVRKALAAARMHGRLGPVLDRLGRQALIAGRRVRTETALGRDRPSIPRVAVQVAGEVLAGLSQRTLLVIGAGKVGGLTARALRRAGAETVIVTNRTPAAAAALAGEIGALTAPFAALDDLLGRADIVISCTGSPAPLLDAARLARIVAGRGGRPLVLVDIAVPRDVAPAARAVPGVRLFDLDDLRSAAAATIDLTVVAQAEAIVDAETGTFLTWLAGRQAVPTIRALRQRAELVLEEELARASGDEAHLREFGRRLLNKLLHRPVVRMRHRAATHGSTYLDIARDLFALDGHEDG
jgi:glutamyl-tRNA reductase